MHGDTESEAYLPPVISLLVVDIDNTLYDWFSFWSQSFTAMLQTVLDLTQLDRKQLLSEIREIHRKHRTSEYAFLLQETPSIASLPPNTREAVVAAGRQAFRAARERDFNLYPGVRETLVHVRKSGAHIAAFTESQLFYTARRLVQFELDGVIEALYCSSDHLIPDGVDVELLRSRAAEDYILKWTRVVTVPAIVRKPDSTILTRIARDFGVPVDRMLYVGDSLRKDVSMAHEAGAHDAFAKYGQPLGRSGYPLLRDVSHWTDAEITDEALSQRDIRPTTVLKASFSELLTYFRFLPPDSGRSDAT